MDTLNYLTDEELADINFQQEQDINNARQEEYETISALELFETGLSKTGLKSMANVAVESVLKNGNVLQVAEALSAMENFIKEVKDDVRFKAYAREEISKYPKGYNSNSGAKIECAEVGTKYDFSKCNDPILKIIESELERFNQEYKNRTDMLKTVPLSGLEILVNDELIKVYPPSKTSTSSYKIQLAK